MPNELDGIIIFPSFPNACKFIISGVISGYSVLIEISPIK